MSLLQNEDFTVWQLRTSYLSTIKDGVGDRLITLNSSVLNTPGFRAAGWSGSAASAYAASLKRTYSPPIPVATAVASEYSFSALRNTGNGGETGDGDVEDHHRSGAGFSDDEEGGMITGARNNMNAIFPLQSRLSPGKKGRRRKQQNQPGRPHHRHGEAEEDDSSDLSDDSDEDASESRAVHQIKFTKMPVRNRAGSSPIRRSDRLEGPKVLITSPSIRSIENQYRRNSLGAVEAVKARARGDTITSSDMSSDNDLDPDVLRRRQIHFSGKEEIIEAPDETSSEKLEEEVELDTEMANRIHDNDDDSIAGSVGSALSSDFGVTAGSSTLLDRVAIGGGLGSSSPLAMRKIQIARDPRDVSPKKPRPLSPIIQSIPPRPISIVGATSLLSSMLQARKKAPVNPLEKYAAFSGKGDTATPLYIKIFVPSSSSPAVPIDMPAVRESKDKDQPGQITVAQTIGLSLWRYMEEGMKPPLQGDRLSVNRWHLRIVDDGEVDYDFPPLSRDRLLTDFTSNNNRAAAFRGRSRSKPYDEFALVEASDAEFKENEKHFPKYSIAASQEADENQHASVPPVPVPVNKGITNSRANPILGQPFPSALNDSSLTPADRPAVPTSHATPRMGVSKTLRVRYIDLESSTRTTTLNTSTDSYIAEILDSVCKKWGLDKGNFLLKVLGSNTIAPLDRTVEALGNISELDLVRRRFGIGPLSMTGSPGSSSPNAPLLIEPQNPSSVTKKGKRGGRMLHPLAQQQDVIGGYYRRYQVIRKQSMSLTASSQRVLAFDHDYIHILPAESGRTLFESNAKTTSISFNDVVGSKVSRRHPKSFRIVVLRGNEANEQKRYDFDAKNALEAAEIVEEIKKNMLHFQI
ncbi:Component of a membrane-bound complex containing the Tor2p kinase [Emydomyces testavorans]|uniref:Component of a membrane-bound complex containing the Tor2p kinase n=1 Tax=Emydomyces testavorans TaxID=2070801 RepID=A0AAF0DEI0_9EURO|nr:Component of a membrane-bound complex containing the Tor2p kinase [Emydomyces testavorans]